MLKCAILADFLDFEKVAATLRQLHAREEKTRFFFVFFFHFCLRTYITLFF